MNTRTVVIAFALLGCTDATCADSMAFGDAQTVRCYSGGEVFYEGRSTGRVEAADRGAGLRFMDAKTRRLVRIYADCIVLSDGATP